MQVYLQTSHLQHDRMWDAGLKKTVLEGEAQTVECEKDVFHSSIGIQTWICCSPLEEWR